MKTAWMIRNDGVLFPIDWHVYGNNDILDVEETLSAAEWLYSATLHEEVKALIVSLIRSWAEGLPIGAESGSISDKIKRYVKELPYRIMTVDFLNSISIPLEKRKVYTELDGLNQLVNSELNQEFLRARYGGMYDTNPNSAELFFRTSSVGFDWIPTIKDFICANVTLPITGITIVRDRESTNYANYYLSMPMGIVKNITPERFLSQNTIFTADITSQIPSACSLQKAFSNRNMQRIIQKVAILNHSETKSYYAKD